MHLVSHKTSTKIIFALVIVAFLTFNLLGLVFSMSDMKMDINGLGTMSNCIFGGQGHPCNMSLTEHIGIWQGMSVMSVQKVFSLDILILLAVMSLALTIALGRDLLAESKQLILKYTFYLKYNFNITLFFSYLREAFSQGILNPKIYAFAI